ncbi:ABC transporter substrate-binding protein [Bradyrhizobium genosp. P]|uniref:ABC transporter substrate-binding protein n=1 Tax=Bradyrhizobium genosp. P TaxID=83641 RepID=UPI003CEED480
MILTNTVTGPATAADPGVTDTEVKLGQTMPYSGPASAFVVAARVEAAFYQMINARGGVNGRKITLISLDDAYSPPKTVEQTRRLVEQDEVFAMVGSLGTPTNSAVQRYLNSKKVPQVFISTGASKWNDPQHFPYTLALAPPYQLEGETFSKYVLANRPDAKIGIMTQNDDAGRDYVSGIRKGLGERAARMIVQIVTYENSDPTVDSQVVKLKASGADTLFSGGTPRIAAQTIRKIGELGWKPFNWIVAPANSIKAVLEPAGVENAKGLVTTLAYKSPVDPRWQNDSDVKEFQQFVKDWMPQADLGDSNLVVGYVSAYLTTKILESCGKDLSRENFMKQVTTLSNVRAPMLLPGITLTTSPNRYAPFSQLQMARFDGVSWVPEGPVIAADDLSR